MPSVFETLVRHSDNPSSFLALNQGNEYFRDPRFDGTCVYRRSGRHLVQFAGPFAAEEQRAGLLDAFAAQARPRRLVAVQLQRADAELYGAHGFTVNQLGASYAVDLGRFTLRGSAGQSFGAWLAPGVELTLWGDANDYTGKGDRKSVV